MTARDASSVAIPRDVRIQVLAASGAARADAVPVTDERPPEIRHISVSATPGDRRFVLCFVAALFSCFAVVLLLALLIDPLGSYGTGLTPPLVPNDRDAKAIAYARLSPRPTAVILGSSRVMKIPPACLQTIVGMRVFNFGLNSARAEDDLAVWRFVQSQGPVHQVLIGLDPEALHNSVGPDDRLLRSRRLAPFVDPTLRPHPLARLYRGGVEALRGETFTASLRSIWFVLTGRRPEAAYVFDSTGFLHMAWERQVGDTHYEPAPHVEASVIPYRQRYEGFSALSARRIAALLELLDRARAAGARVDAFIPPLHPALVSAMARTTLAERTRETEDLLSELDKRGLLHFTRLPTLASFGGDPALYFDGAHMMEANAVRLLRAVYGDSTACAVQ